VKSEQLVEALSPLIADALEKRHLMTSGDSKELSQSLADVIVDEALTGHEGESSFSRDVESRARGLLQGRGFAVSGSGGVIDDIVTIAKVVLIVLRIFG